MAWPKTRSPLQRRQQGVVVVVCAHIGGEANRFYKIERSSVKPLSPSENLSSLSLSLSLSLIYLSSREREFAHIYTRMRTAERICAECT